MGSSVYRAVADVAAVLFSNRLSSLDDRKRASKDGKHPLPPEGLPHTSIRTRVGHSIGKLHLSQASTLLNEPPPLMDQKDAAVDARDYMYLVSAD